MRFLSSVARRGAGFGALLGVCMASAVAAPPAAPAVTTGADIKRLLFDWDPVPQASSYQLWFKAGTGSDYVKFGDYLSSRTHASNGISAHLLRWEAARYQVRACNSSGCTSSPDIPVGDLQQDSIGYLKSQHSAPGGRFGDELAISEDASTLAVAARFESDRAMVYVYRWVDGRWAQRALLMPGDFTGGQTHVQVTLSADGSVLAMRSGQMVEQGEGAVYLYRYDGTTWQFEQQLSGGEREEFEAFGENPRLTADGTRLLVSYSNGRSEIYRHATGGWVLYKQFNGYAFEGGLPVLSGDGQVLARCARINGEVVVEIDRTEVPNDNIKRVVVSPASENHHCAGIDIDYLGAIIAVGHRPSTPVTAAWKPGVAVVRASGSNYLVTSKHTPGAWQRTIGNRPSDFGNVVRLSRSGEFLAITDDNDSGAGHDVMAPPLATSGIGTGAVYVYEKKGGGYLLRRVLKPHVVDQPDFHFGNALAFANFGKALALGHPSERSGAFGSDGDRDDTSADFSGAVWYY